MGKSADDARPQKLNRTLGGDGNNALKSTPDMSEHMGTPADNGSVVASPRKKVPEAKPVDLSAPMEIQIAGKGAFSPCEVRLHSGVLSVNPIRPGAHVARKKGAFAAFAADVGTLSVSRPKSKRQGRKYCLKLEADKTSEGGTAGWAAGTDKLIMDCMQQATYREWLGQLENMIIQGKDGEGKDERKDKDEFYPNMLFIPLKLHEPAVPAREFALYLILLTVFMFLVTWQDVAVDYKINDAVKEMTNMRIFRRISTAEDYVKWWPTLLTALRRWSQSRPGWTPVAADQQEFERANSAAILLGMPFITQKKYIEPPKSVLSRVSDALDGSWSDMPSLPGVLPPFNGTNGKCSWPVTKASAEQMAEWTWVTNRTVGWCVSELP